MSFATAVGSDFSDIQWLEEDMEHEETPQDAWEPLWPRNDVAWRDRLAEVRWNMFKAIRSGCPTVVKDLGQL